VKLEQESSTICQELTINRDIKESDRLALAHLDICQYEVLLTRGGSRPLLPTGSAWPVSPGAATRVPAKLHRLIYLL